MPQFQVPTTDTRTKAEKLADGLLARGNQLEEFLVQFHQDGFQQIWHNEDPEITPDAIFARMGPQSTAYLLKAYNLVQFLLNEGVELTDEQWQPPRAYTANPDGTITLDP